MEQPFQQGREGGDAHGTHDADKVRRDDDAERGWGAAEHEVLGPHDETHPQRQVVVTEPEAERQAHHDGDGDGQPERHAVTLHTRLGHADRAS
jgi:hypothetical protein